MGRPRWAANASRSSSMRSGGWTPSSWSSRRIRLRSCRSATRSARPAGVKAPGRRRGQGRTRRSVLLWGRVSPVRHHIGPSSACSPPSHPAGDDERHWRHRSYVRNPRRMPQQWGCGSALLLLLDGWGSRSVNRAPAPCERFPPGGSAGLTLRALRGTHPPRGLAAEGSRRRALRNQRFRPLDRTVRHSRSGLISSLGRANRARKPFKIESVYLINRVHGMHCHERHLTCRYSLASLTGSRKVPAGRFVMDPK